MDLDYEDDEIQFRDQLSISTQNNNAVPDQEDVVNSDEENENVSQQAKKGNRKFTEEKLMDNETDETEEINNARRLSSDDGEEVIEAACARLQQIMDSSEFSETASLIREHFGTLKKQQKGNHNNATMQDTDNNSEVTVYRNALLDHTMITEDNSNRLSSSSEELIKTSKERINTSEELVDQDQETNLTQPINRVEQIITDFIVENRPQQKAEKDARDKVKSTVRRVETAPRAGPSKEIMDIPRDEEDQVDKLVKQAENARTKMFSTPGRIQECELNLQKDYVHSTMVDDDYIVLVAHVDESLKEKIRIGDYVDLPKLLPRDRIAHQEDQRLQLVVRNGQSF